MKNISKSISAWLFRYRSYTPIPFIIIMLLYENANIWSLITGFAFVVTGELIRLWGVSWAGSETRTTSRPEGSYLIVSGPFAHTRNPLYTGNIIIYLGIGIMSFAIFPYLQIIALAFFIFQYHFIIKAEEEFLSAKYGMDYKHYKENVPRFLWRISSYKKKDVKQPTFKLNAGLKSERRTFQAIGIVTITIILLWFIGRY